MIGLDTNILIRFFVKDDATQTALARKTLTTRCSAENPGYISLVVLVEMLWVLLSYYKYDRAQIAELISSVAQTRELVVEDEDLVIHALEIFQETKAGFADILIALKSEQAGCTETLTFDRRAARDAGMTLAE